MPRLYARLSVISGEPADDNDVGDDGYGVLAAVAGESCSLLVASGVLAASVIIWEACAFAALAAALAAGVAWCLRVVAGAGRAPAGTAAPAGAARRPCGLGEMDIRAPPKSPFQRRVGPAGGVTCSVCLEDVRAGEMVRSLPECRHLFHVGCIDPWLQLHVTCPLCRSDLSPRRRAMTMAAAEVGLQLQADSRSPQ